MVLDIGDGLVNENLEERKRKANDEFHKLIKWANAESDKVSEQLDKEGAIRALDTNREAYAYIQDTFRKRVKEIAEKYDLPVPNLR